MNRNQIVGMVLFLAFIPLGFLLYRYIDEQSGLVKAHFVRGDGSTSSEFKLEVADTDPKRAKGLMHRKDLDPRRGMIFIYPTEENHSFWMKNTFIPLDIIFLDRGYKIVGILENLPILNEGSQRISKPSKLAVELLGGTAKREKLAEGMVFAVKDKILPAGK